ncbi:hypothetical protein FW778_00545 [Ginsengibacter hankyongi]|uniref:Lipoprotein n=1 Tax=Ginsengibacter hankyongi TaxID=2607284 RepID=A0A5J5IKK4_9BACT|nr:hypothetical protein [Ginsengibacter hankyongi]KAA9040567.1 hypothetical protein FW778_00545 [Ginsengibacter hankyongi]
MPNANFSSFQKMLFSHRKLFSLVIILGACCILQACNSGNNKQINRTDTTSRVSTDTSIPSKSFLSKICIESNLHILYASTPDMVKLYRRLHVQRTEKIIFQIYWQNGVFSLAAFEGKKEQEGNTDFGNNRAPLILQVSSEFPGTGVFDMNGINVLLSDQELNSKNDQHSNNDDIANLHNYLTGSTPPPANFITFTPSIVPLSPNIYTIQYVLGYTNKEPSRSPWEKNKPFFMNYPAIPGVSPTNPTPPRNSY